jgi:4-hydroxybenzoate polyprenyltransferase
MARPSSPTVSVAEPARVPDAPRGSTFGLILASLRPEQWTKNLLVFAGLLFGGRLLEPIAVAEAAAAFVVFCGLSGAVYLINDVADLASDQRHPLKRSRPIAAGRLAAPTAMLAAAALGGAAIAGSLLIRPAFAVAAAAFFLLLILYSAGLKHVVIIDVLTIAGGFVLRAVAGAIAVDVPISDWLIVCTTLLALFLALSKRRHEILLLGDGAMDHRRILDEYSPYLLDQMIAVVTASTLVAYSIYATSAETAERLGTTRLGLTIPFVLYGIFRYLYLVHQKGSGGNPAAMLVSDRPLLACVALWTLSVALCLYSPLGR